MAALSAINIGVIVVVGGVQATLKTKFLICDCVKFDLLTVPLSYSFLLEEYRKSLPFIMVVSVDASQCPFFFFDSSCWCDLGDGYIVLPPEMLPVSLRLVQ